MRKTVLQICALALVLLFGVAASRPDKVIAQCCGLPPPPCCTVPK